MLMVIQQHPALHSVALGKSQIAVQDHGRVISGITARHRIVTAKPNKCLQYSTVSDKRAEKDKIRYIGEMHCSNPSKALPVTGPPSRYILSVGRLN